MSRRFIDSSGKVSADLKKWGALLAATVVFFVAVYFAWPQRSSPNIAASNPAVTTIASSGPALAAGVGDDKELAAMKKKIPPLKGVAERTSTIAKESLPELVANLANFDDYIGAASSVPSNSPSNAYGQSLIVTRLARVRRLLEEARTQREEVCKLMRQTLVDTGKQWRGAFEALFGDGRALGVLHAPDDFMKIRLRSLAATYVLAVIEDYDSLALILTGDELHELHKPGELRRYGPVPRAIIMYAAHKLIETYPTAKLTPAAKTARENYMATADLLIPPIRTAKVTRWNAAYEESDPALQMMDGEKILLRGQPTMTLEVFPTKFAGGQHMSDEEGNVTVELATLLSKAKLFAAVITDRASQ